MRLLSRSADGHRAGASALRMAAMRLFEAGAALACLPAPALLMDGLGRVVAANPSGDRLAADHAAELEALSAHLVASGREGAATLTALPLAPGRVCDVVGMALGDGCSVLMLGSDATPHATLRSALTESRQRYKDLVELSSDFVWETGADGVLVFVSPRGALGYAAATLIGRRAEDFLLRRSDADLPLPFTSREQVIDDEVWFRRADGGEVCLRTLARPLFDENGNWLGARGACRDVTEERARDVALAQAGNRERLLAHILRTVRDEADPRDMLSAAAMATGRAFVARGCEILRCDQNGTALTAASFGTEIDPAVRQGVLAAMASSTAETDIVTFSTAAVSILAARTRYRGGVNGALWLWRPVGPDHSVERPEAEWSADDRSLIAEIAAQLAIANEQIRNHEALDRLSRTDELTGLMNRRAFFEDVAGRIVQARRSGRSGALVYVDLDNFKLVNDRLGHQAGDDALHRVAGILSAGARGDDLVARLGGDEFALWLEDTDEKGARVKAAALLADGRPLAALSSDEARPLGLSVGIAVWDPVAVETLDQLVERADAAMYEVKRRGKGSALVAAPAVTEALAERGAAS